MCQCLFFASSSREPLAVPTIVALCSRLRSTVQRLQMREVRVDTALRTHHPALLAPLAVAQH